MKRNFKRTLVALIAATTMSVGTSGMSASAYNYSEPWETFHTEAGAPVYSGQADSVAVVYSVKGSTCYQNSVESSVNGGTGYVYITCNNGTMNPITMYRSAVSRICKPTYTGAIPCASYTLRAYSTTSGATYTCSGNMVTNQ